MSQFNEFVNEEWRPVVGYEGWYEVSNWGRVKRVRGGKAATLGKILKPCILPNGYHRVILYRAAKGHGCYIHHLVGNAFLGRCPRGLERNHKDGDKDNNTPGNIEYITHAANQVHASENGLIRVGTRCSYAKLNEMLVRVIKLNLKFERAHTVAKWFGKPTSTIYNIESGSCWKHVTLG